jgi:hypothetical protein
MPEQLASPQVKFMVLTVSIESGGSNSLLIGILPSFRVRRAPRHIAQEYIDGHCGRGRAPPHQTGKGFLLDEAERVEGVEPKKESVRR